LTAKGERQKQRLILSDSDREKIRAQWTCGELSQDKLAARWGVSKGVISKICKGVPQDMTEGVQGAIALAKSIQGKSDRQVTEVTTVILDRMRREGLRDTAAEVILKRVIREAHDCDIQHLKAITDAAHKASDMLGVIAQDKGIIINNTNAQQNNISSIPVINDNVIETSKVYSEFIKDS